MKILRYYPGIFTLIFLFPSISATSQHVEAVRLKGNAMRETVVLDTGANRIDLLNLAPGNVYTIVASRAVRGQNMVFDFYPTDEFRKASTDFICLPGKKNAFRFTSNDTSAQFMIKVSSGQVSQSFPVMLSVGCKSCPRENTGLQKFSGKSLSTNLTITENVPVSSLVKDALIGGTCYDVTNITSFGNIASQGRFSNGSSSIGISEGIVLATDEVSLLPGPNNTYGISGGFNFNSPNDPDLATITPSDQFDLSKIEFDFTPTDSIVKFDYVFGSEEYCEFITTQFNDAFGFFISGPGITGTQNIAVLPGTNIPVSIHTINQDVNSSYYINNSTDSNCNGAPVFNLNDCQLDGWTSLLTATAHVIPCSVYHIKLAIADISDPYVNTAVFIRANSFNAGGTAKVTPVFPPGIQIAYEGCQQTYLNFKRDSNDLTQPLEVYFTIGGTATPGIDYTPLTSPVTIPAGQDSLLVPLHIFSDGINEPQENILIALHNSCTCTPSQTEILVSDEQPFMASIDDKIVCEGQPASISPVIKGGLIPYKYAWNTGAATESISVFATGDYTVTITDPCSDSLVKSAHVTVIPLPVRSDTTYFCPGSSIMANGQVFTQPGTSQQILPGLNGACDTVFTHHILSLTPAPSKVNLKCPADIYTSTTDGEMQTVVTYDLAAGSTNCICPGLSIIQSVGLTSGNAFPVGTSEVCYLAKDSCGQSASCCFKVTVAESSVCDRKEIGCMKFELLTITYNSLNAKTYRIRVTNNCANKMDYVLTQLPNGMTASLPVNNSIFTGPGGHEFLIRNPSFSPFYAVRFSSLTDSLFNGSSEIIKYSLPPWAPEPNYIHMEARLELQSYYEAYLNTFYCPLIYESVGKPENDREEVGTVSGRISWLFPNPTEGVVYVGFSELGAIEGKFQILNTQGQLVYSEQARPDEMVQKIVLPGVLPNGMYFFQIIGPENVTQAKAFVLQR
jgi:hypothetical protein